MVTMHAYTPRLFIAAVFGLALLASRPAAAGNYTECFDNARSWYGGAMYEYSAKQYTNAVSASLEGTFSSDWALRSSNAFCGPYAWKVAAGEHWFRYATTSGIYRFSLYLARDSGETPDINIRYSRNSGATWDTVYSGTTLLGNQDLLVYTQFVSPDLNIVPHTGYMIYLEVYKFLGAPIQADRFSLDFYGPNSNTVYMSSPAPPVTRSTGDAADFLTRSIADGQAQIGYGLGSNGTGWTWLDTGPSNVVFGSAATNRFWLTSGSWYYAARWIRSDTSVTNYGWTTAGQTGATSLNAEYQVTATNYSWSSVWEFDTANDTSPSQQPAGLPGEVFFSTGLSSNIPGNGILEVTGFSAGLSTQKWMTFYTAGGTRAGKGFYCALQRDTAGPTFITMEYSFDGVTWTTWKTNLALITSHAWYMAGGTQMFSSFEHHWYVRITGYGGSNGVLACREAQFAALVPEPVPAGIISILAFVLMGLHISKRIQQRELL